jgi:hypothetical protein
VKSGKNGNLHRRGQQYRQAAVSSAPDSAAQTTPSRVSIAVRHGIARGASGRESSHRERKIISHTRNPATNGNSQSLH